MGIDKIGAVLQDSTITFIAGAEWEDKENLSYHTHGTHGRENIKKRSKGEREKRIRRFGLATETAVFVPPLHKTHKRSRLSPLFSLQ